MKKQAIFFFYLLGAYVIVQFTWWAYHIIQLTQEVGYSDASVSKRIGMIVGEGLVFFMILIFGLWRILKSLKKEHELAKRQHNFLLSVTHELKTPLASTKLYLQTLLKRNFEAEKREELLQKALIENQRLEEIVDAILISARIENRTLEIHKEHVNLKEEIQKVVNQYGQKYHEKLISCELENITVNTDIFMFKTIVINLIENAIKYAGKEKTIEIKLFKKEEHIVLRLSDFGPGIPLEQREIIFQKFVRLENEETRSKKGTGLGLFIVKEFTNLLGGEIKYIDNVPNGAVFELTF
ncbi:MAG: HAMP domain-containing sensor histidine kinase [Bacteroidota bacterium]